MRTADAASNKTLSIPKVATIGTGIAGSLFILQALKKNYIVHAYDLNNSILGTKSSTANEMFKLHIGLHYFSHYQTAEECLRDSFAFALAFHDCILGHGKENDFKPYRRGRHYIMSNSLFNAKIARETAEKLRAVYAQLCLKHDIQPFGPPEHFIKELTDPSEYKDIASEIPWGEESSNPTQERVVCAFDTGESQMDIEALKARLEKEYAPYIKSGQLTFHPLTEVTEINYKNLGYEVTAKDLSDNNNIKKEYYDGVVNCAWQNIEKINRGLNLPKLSVDETYIRPKIFLTVQLPESLQNFNTSIFSIGPFASITNRGNGKALLAYEPVTNIGAYKAGEEPDSELKAILEADLTSQTSAVETHIQKILSGCAKFLAKDQMQALLKANIESVNLGYVRHSKRPNEKIDIAAVDSAHHRRQESGIVAGAFAYINFSSMKMTYAQKSAKDVAETLEKHFAIKNRFFRKIVASDESIDYEYEKLRIKLSHLANLANKEIDSLYDLDYELMLSLAVLMDKTRTSPTIRSTPDDSEAFNFQTSERNAAIETPQLPSHIASISSLVTPLRSLQTQPNITPVIGATLCTKIKNCLYQTTYLPLYLISSPYQNITWVANKITRGRIGGSPQ